MSNDVVYYTYRTGNVLETINQTLEREGKTMNFKTEGLKATTLSVLMESRDKISMDEIIENYPFGVTVMAFDIIKLKGEDVPVLTFAEDDSKFFFGGAQLKAIVQNWVSGDAAEHDGVIDVARTSLALTESGGVKVKFLKIISKAGRAVTTVLFV